MKIKPKHAGYSHAEVDTFSAGRLWQEFGLHRGVMLNGNYHYLGNETEVGGVSGQYRMVFSAFVALGPNYTAIKGMNPRAPLQGPVLGGQKDSGIASAFERYVAPIREYLNNEHTPKPRLKIKDRPGIIDYADRPDVGAEAPRKTKPTIKFRQPEVKPKFRLPIRRAQ
jgi:hypothetical protein